MVVQVGPAAWDPHPRAARGLAAGHPSTGQKTLACSPPRGGDRSRSMAPASTSMACGPGCCASPTRWPRNGQPDQRRPFCSRKGPCFWPQARFRHLVRWRRCRRPMACSCPDQCGRGGRQAVSTSLLKRARTLATPPSKAARAPRLAPTCRSRRPRRASRSMAQAIAKDP